MTHRSAPAVYPHSVHVRLGFVISDTQKGAEDGGGRLLVCTVTTWTNKHNDKHTGWRKLQTEKKEEKGWMNTGPSADSGDDDVPVCPLKSRQQSWRWCSWQALPVGSGTAYRSDTPPHHQALLPGS